MIEFVFGGFLLIVIWATYSCYYWPKNYKNKYATKLRNLGYSVYETPYKPFQVSYEKEPRMSTRDHDDAFYHAKTIYSSVDVALQHLFNKQVLILINPDLMKEFFGPDKTAIYPKTPALIEAIQQLLGYGMIFSEGAKWKHKRRLVSNAFNFDLLKQNIPKICNIIDRKIAAMEQKSKIKDGKFQFEVMDLGNQIFNGVMMACFFGQDQVKEKVDGQVFDDFIKKLMDDANQISLHPLVVLLGRKAFTFGGLTPQIRDVLRRSNLLKDVASKIIAKRTEEVSKGIKSSNCSDIVQNLIKAAQKCRQKGIAQTQLTNKDLVEEFCTFVIAGTDTTTCFFTMMVYYMIQHPQMQKKLRKDIDQFIKGDQDYNYENLKKLTYIDWIQSQTSRHYGPAVAVFYRQAAEDNFIGKIPVRKGDYVGIQTVGTHHSDRYFKNPEQFRPERWESECNNLKPFALSGFSGGPRACIGKQLAMLQSKIALIKLFKRYDKMTIPREKIKMEFKFLYVPETFNTTFFRSN